MAFDVEETLSSHYTDAFEANLSSVPQQIGSRLVSVVDSNLNFTKTGDMFNADDLMESGGPKPIEDRFGKSPEGARGKIRRVGFFEAYDDGEWVDDIDSAKSLSDPTNETMQSMQWGHERYHDDKIIAAMDAPAREGRTGETTVAFPAAQIIAVNDWSYKRKGDASTGNAPLTFAKLNHTKKKLGQSQIPGRRTFVTNEEGVAQLLTDPTITDRESSSVQMLMSGELSTFMGFDWVISERLPFESGTVRKNFGFVRPAIQYRARKLTMATIVRRADRKFNWYAYYKGMSGALRRYDRAVVKVLVQE
ncbi:phage capsid protein [Brevundimonas sp.]|uniref:phage capsid protein n=1 Tax=Brevundimonas sp. TaxID=1871086 RepID=UPI00261356B6|nr:phage capsid protein [Brevundimonas sp.]